jgi:hypothetical protein
MKLQCYREQHALDGVSIQALSVADIPLAEVLEGRVADVTLAEATPGADGDGDGEANGDPPGNGCWGAPHRFRYREGANDTSEVIETEGLIVATGDASLLSFLEHRYVPDDASPRRVDRLTGQLHRGEITRANWLRVMEEEILSRDDPPNRRHPFGGAQSRTPTLLWFRRQAAAFFTERADAAGSYLVRIVHDDETTLAAVAPFQADVAGVAVPRWRFALPGDFDEGFGGWDGRRYRLARDIAELPTPLLRALERDGRVVARPVDWFLPLPDLRAEFLVRVPLPGEVAHLIDAGPPPRLDVLQRPAFCVDTRRPVPLHGRDVAHLEVVHEPPDALAILTRLTARGVYIPNMPPAPVADIPLSPPDQPTRYLAGCWLR